MRTIKDDAKLNEFMRKTMAKWGRKGGLKKSKLKTETARENGKKGGRPKKVGDK